MRYLYSGVALLALAACQSAVPDSGAGVGFGDYASYQQQQAVREAQLTGQALPQAGTISGETPGTVPSAGSDVARETQAMLDATRTNSGVPPVQADPNNPPPEAVNAAGISDENDFAAVDALRSIQDDKARQASLKAQYQQIQPTALPSRAGSGGPSIVEYALSTNTPVGASRYRRTGFNMQARYQTNCAKYPSPDLAQAEFLAKGGPEKDRLGLDPDGDGYACTWDPAPFRLAKNGG